MVKWCHIDTLKGNQFRLQDLLNGPNGTVASTPRVDDDGIPLPAAGDCITLSDIDALRSQPVYKNSRYRSFFVLQRNEKRHGKLQVISLLFYPYSCWLLSTQPFLEYTSPRADVRRRRRSDSGAGLTEEAVYVRVQPRVPSVKVEDPECRAPTRSPDETRGG